MNSLTLDHSMVARHHDPAPAGPSYRGLNLRQRSHTVRPKTTYFPGVDDTDVSGSSATIGTSGDHVISHPQLVSNSKGSKVKEKKKVNRSSTFRSKEKKEEKEKEKEKPAAAASVSSTQASGEDSSHTEQLYISCITALKLSLQEIMVSVGQ